MHTLPQAISAFLFHCRYEKNLSTKTLKAYETDLCQLETFLATKIPAPTDTSIISKIEIREYLSSISHLKPKTIKRKMASVKALFNHLEFEDLIPVSPLRKMKIQIREPRQLPRVMDFKDIARIFKQAYLRLNRLAPQLPGYRQALCNTVIVELLFSTGARVSEVSGLKVESISLESGTIIIKGKGNRERIIHVCNGEALSLIKKYAALVKAQRTTPYFLINRLGNKVSDQSIRNLVRSLAKAAGITKHITPHTFRHTFATLLLEKDVDIKYIQSLLGHSSIVTTQIYTHVNRAKQKQILKAKHPRRDLIMQMESANEG